MKSTKTAYVIWLLTGLLGGHRYYLGKWATGLMMTCTVGGVGVWWLIDGLSLRKTVEDHNRVTEQTTLGLARQEDVQRRRSARLVTMWSQVAGNGLTQQALDGITDEAVDGEVAEAVVPGVHGQEIVATNKRIYIYKPGFMAGAAGGAKVVTWDYRAVYGVQVELGRVTGAVILQTPASKGTDTSYWSTDADGPAKASYAIPVVRSDALANGVRELRSVLDAHQA